MITNQNLHRLHRFHCFVRYYLVFLPHPLLMLAICLMPIGVLMVLRYTFLVILLFIIFSFFSIT